MEEQKQQEPGVEIPTEEEIQQVFDLVRRDDNSIKLSDIFYSLRNNLLENNKKLLISKVFGGIPIVIHQEDVGRSHLVLVFNTMDEDSSHTVELNELQNYWRIRRDAREHANSVRQSELERDKLEKTQKKSSERWFWVFISICFYWLVLLIAKLKYSSYCEALSTSNMECGFFDFACGSARKEAVNKIATSAIKLSLEVCTFLEWKFNWWECGHLAISSWILLYFSKFFGEIKLGTSFLGTIRHSRNTVIESAKAVTLCSVILLWVMIVVNLFTYIIAKYAFGWCIPFFGNYFVRGSNGYESWYGFVSWFGSVQNNQYEGIFVSFILLFIFSINIILSFSASTNLSRVWMNGTFGPCTMSPEEFSKYLEKMTNRDAYLHFSAKCYYNTQYYDAEERVHKVRKVVTCDKTMRLSKRYYECNDISDPFPPNLQRKERFLFVNIAVDEKIYHNSTRIFNNVFDRFKSMHISNHLGSDQEPLQSSFSFHMSIPGLKESVIISKDSVAIRDKCANFTFRFNLLMLFCVSWIYGCWFDGHMFGGDRIRKEMIIFKKRFDIEDRQDFTFR